MTKIISPAVINKGTSKLKVNKSGSNKIVTPALIKTGGSSPRPKMGGNSIKSPLIGKIGKK